MGKVTRDSVKCSGCGYILSFDHAGPCPRCGDTRKTYDLHVEETLHIAGSLHWKRVREYYEKRPVLLTVLIVVTAGAPFLGLVLAGWAGVVVGLLIGVTTFIVGFRAVTKVREIREGS
jgi:hypothetical protein